MTRLPPPPFRYSALLLALSSALSCAAESASDAPMYVEADRVDAQNQADGAKTLKAEGNVVIQQENSTLYSEWATYDEAQKHLRAGDDVRMEKEGDVLTGKGLDYYLDSSTGELSDPDYVVGQGLGRADGVKLLFGGEKLYHIDSGRFTSCPVGNDDWYIHASKLDLDYIDNMGVARNGWIQFKGVPVMYSPWMNFPLTGNRQTGMLTPTVSFDSRSGVDLLTPFYWNIAPNYDATLYPHYMTERGLMLGGEFRYLQPNYSGQIGGSFIKDKETDTNRSSFTWLHNQQFTSRLSGHINIQSVSDDDYFNDFGSRDAIAEQTNLPREAGLNYAGDGWNASLLWQRFQTLQSDTNAVDIPYDRMPVVNFSAAPSWIKGVQTSVAAEFADFNHPTKVNGTRTWITPTVKMPFNTAYSFIVPKISLDATYYQLQDANGQNDRTESRVLPITSIDSGLFFERDADWRGNEYIQTLEPRLFYVYVPYKDQSMLPNFDSGLTDLSMTQLFSDNKFVGHDRINDANEITAALTSRILDAEDGSELFRATIGQRYYFTTPKVTLDNSAPSDATKTDLLLSVGGQLWKQFKYDYTLQYDGVNSRTSRADASLQWAPDAARVINLRYTRNTNAPINYNSNGVATTDGILEQVDLSGQWPLGRGWYGVGRYTYSLHDSQTFEALAGLEYNAGCWAFRMAAQRYITSDGDYNTTYFAVLELGGLGLGSNPVGTLRDSIPGYSSTFDTLK
ncbi:LPS-assembly protein LptD [Jeongeupia naejangsanensis]|uniref:LPS-assembly protein LptD n=1 Tax=Jeongeupia naejangsanensis TaxID=613195 RepID=A0ABS2BP70_9NEIS|nr:LPS-assembly protein LptD [Jeongeupia naejangsanensis]MBM3117215.1 LPS-assembly protein LptD [Jeongeupia naejangsanensis]